MSNKSDTQPLNTDTINIACPNCHALQTCPRNLDGKVVRCISCSESFIATALSDLELKDEIELAQHERTQKQVDAFHIQMIQYLEQNKTIHFLSLDADNRKSIEDEFNNIMSKNIAAWSQYECQIYILLSNIPGWAELRDSYWKAQMIALLSVIASNNASIINTQNNLAHAINDIASKLGSVRAAATVGGMWAAGELGKQMFGGEG